MRLLVAVTWFITATGCGAPAATPLSSGEGESDISRLVSLGGGTTEVVFALGHGGAVVAADASSTYPEQAASVATLGYHRRIQGEGVVAQRPTLVLAEESSGPPAALAQIEAAGISVATIPKAETIAEAQARISAIAALLGEEAKAQALRDAMDHELAEIRDAVADRPRPRVLFIYARGGGTLQVAGSGTSVEALIHAAGGVLAAPGHEGFAPLTSEAVVAAQPDVVLLTTKGLQSMGGEAGVLAAPGIAATPAGQGARVLAIDDLLLLGFGPRIGTAARTLARGLHPEVVP